MPPRARKTPPWHARRFLFVTGKGGVGKTTVTASLALVLASRGKRVLVAMPGAHERLSSLLRTPPIGHDIVQLRERVWATKMDPERAMEEYGELVIKVRAITRIVFANEHTQSFFRAVPGLHEWAMLGKAWYHSIERTTDDVARFDTVLFDAPSTGHGLDMLRIPRVILGAVPPGVLRRDAERAWATFRDERQSGVVVVSWPEEMPVTETLELVQALRTDLELPIASVVVNGVLGRLFDDREREILLRDSDLLLLGSGRDPAADPGTWALSSAARRALREQLQSRCLERLAQGLGMPFVTLPFLVEGAGSPEGLELLASRLLDHPDA